MKKVLRAIKDIIFLFLAIILIYAMIGNISGVNDKVYDIVKFRNYVVLTGSMEPNISAGDFVTIRKCNVDKLQTGDIITFYLNNEVVTHRIQSIDGDKILTKGDANNVVDSYISKKDVIGKYMFRIPKFGYLISFLTSTSGLILIIGCILILLFWDLSGPRFAGKKIIVVNKEEYEEYVKYKNNIKGKDENK